MKRRILALALLIILAIPVLALADTVSLSNITASWVNGQPDAAPTYYGNGTTNPIVTWGVGVNGPPSAYEFTAVGGTINVDAQEGLSDPFQVGTFTHQNNTISASGTPFLTSISLQLNMDVDINGVPQGLQTFSFNFFHNETDNNPLWGTCANGLPNYSGVNINGCADNVQFTGNTWENTFYIGDTSYTLGLYGFVQGDEVVNNWWTIERMDNDADLMAYVGLRENHSEVPEPTSAVLLLSGMGVLGFIRKR